MPILNSTRRAAALVEEYIKHVPIVEDILASELHLPVRSITLLKFQSVYNCKTCGGTGMTGYPCPVHAAYTSTGSYVSANNALSYGSNNGYGENPGSGQQGYGAASGHYVDDLGGKAV
jgi:hypothetical protein